MKINSEKAGNISVFFALVLAYFARSILAGALFGIVPARVYYILTYLCITTSLYLNRKKVRTYFWWLLLISAVILLGMYQTGDYSAIIPYFIAVLLPMVIPENIINSRNWYRFIIVTTSFVSVGCFFSLLFPSLYRSLFLPMFQGRDYRSISNLLKNDTHGGFISQTGYASFFISVGLGALYSFRKIFSSRIKLYTLGAFFFSALLITQKRNPLIMLVITMLIVYYIEGEGSQRFSRFFYIILAMVGIYIGLAFLSFINVNVPGADKVYETMNSLVSGSGVDDTGRTQLYGQAFLFFKEHPIIGIGWTNFKNLFVLRRTHVHNIYLQLLCETGISGFIVFVAFFIFNLRRSCRIIKNWTGEKTEISYGWLRFSLFIQVFFLLFGITENPLYDTEHATFYFMAIGIAEIISINVIRNSKLQKSDT